MNIEDLLIHGPPIIRRYGEDAWQEALTRFLERPPKDHTHLDRWLRVVARNYTRKSHSLVLPMNPDKVGQSDYSRYDDWSGIGYRKYHDPQTDPRPQIDARLALLELNPELVTLGKLQLERALTSTERKRKSRLVAEALGLPRNARRRR